MIGFGCMRLSTSGDRDDALGLAVLRAALDAGLRFFDTADAYCLDEADTGHNERLLAQAIAAWPGDRGSLTIATKGGLVRPQGRWTSDGRARHLTAACEASCRALGVNRIDLYQLHAPDPATPLATSVRALAALQRNDLIDRIGLCNVTVGQIQEARRLAPIASVQVELGPWQDAAVLGGVAAYCFEHGIQLIAYRPFGGTAKRGRAGADPVLGRVAARRSATPEEVALAWLSGLTPGLIAIPGAARVETACSIGRAAQLTLTDDDRRDLDAHFPIGPAIRSAVSGRPSARPPATSSDREIVMIMGLPGAGKSTLARTLVERGYARLNRDEAGGSLRDLLPRLEALVQGGATRVVLDNTYLSRASRTPLVQTAARLGMPLRCVHLTTTVEDAQVNAVLRMIRKHERLLSPEDMRTAVRSDPSAFAPSAQFRSQRELEPPDPAEGFSAIEATPFTRASERDRTAKALIVWCDAALADRPRARELLQRYASDGWSILGLAWRPEVADGSASPDDVHRAFVDLQRRLGVAIDIRHCPHPAGPPVCWCRKPLPGLGVLLIEQYRLDPAACIYVGNGSQDPGFARRLGFQYRDAGAFFH